MLRRIGRLGILGLAVALLALPATGSAKKKANPCAKKKAEKKGCVLKVVAYGNKSGDPLFYLQAGAVYDKPTKSVLTVSFKDSCGDIRIVDLKATAYPEDRDDAEVQRDLRGRERRLRRVRDRDLHREGHEGHRQGDAQPGRPARVREDLVGVRPALRLNARRLSRAAHARARRRPRR